jgi:23S rRNA pseudouridine1911/1915/1917 synthase
MKILYEDSAIAVCVKPAGVQSQLSANGKDMINLLNAHFAENGETTAEAYPVHRLDKETSGVMVYAKTKAAAANLSAQIAENKIKKRYFAVIKGEIPQKQGILKDLLFRDKQKNKTYTVKTMRKGVKEASLEYKVKGEKDGFALLDILLHTGRTHQIRAQFSSRGFPLYGDRKYGGCNGDLALFAYSLEFVHPINGETCVFKEMPTTDIHPWSMF